MKAELILIIKTDLDLKGKGTSKEPYRRLIQYWSIDGQLLAEVDPLEEKDKK